MDCFSNLPAVTYFPYVTLRLRDLIIRFNGVIASNNQEEFKDVHDDIIDQVLYIQDIFSLNIDKINYVLTNSLMYYVILPLICGSIISMSEAVISISLSMYILAVLFQNIKNESFLNLLFSIIFGESVDPKIEALMNKYPEDLKYYEFNLSNSSQKFVDYISLNYSKSFIKSLVFQNNSPYDEVNVLIAKFCDSSSNSFNISDEIDKPEVNEKIVAEVFSLLSDEDLDMMNEFHKDVIRCTGIGVGFSNTDKGKGIVNILDQNFRSLSTMEVLVLLILVR